jgi:hypothetical protein
VLRGGCWNNNDRANLLSSNRNYNQPGNRNNNNGFRCVLVVSGGKALEPAVRRVRSRKQSSWIHLGRKLWVNSAKKAPPCRDSGNLQCKAILRSLRNEGNLTRTASAWRKHSPLEDNASGCQGQDAAAAVATGAREKKARSRA